jgi:hypothetical protein
MRMFKSVATGVVVTKETMPLNQKSWTEEELEWLRKNYRFRGLQQSAKHLNRSPQSILHKVSRMGLRRYNTHKQSKIHVHDTVVSLTDESSKYYEGKRNLEQLFNRPLQDSEVIRHKKLRNYEQPQSERVKK